MSSSGRYKEIFLAGIIFGFLTVVNGSPARILSLEADDPQMEQVGSLDDADGIIHANGYENDKPEDTENENNENNGQRNGAGMFGRLWSDFSSSLNLFGSTRLEDRLKKFRSESLNSMREGVKEIHGIRSRHKRDHPLEDVLTRDTKGYYKLSQLDTYVNGQLKSFPSPPVTISMEVFEHLKFVFWLVTEDYTADNPGALHVYMLDPVTGNLQKAITRSLGANKCVPVLKLENFVEIVCVETQGHKAKQIFRKGSGSGVYRITWDNGLKVSFLRALKTLTAQDVAVWEFGDSHLLAFANSFDPDKNSGEILSVIYLLQTTVLSGVVYTNYDNLDTASFGTKYAYGMEAFRIVSRQFLAVANHRDDIGNVEVDSVIYIFDFHRKTLKPFQRIRTSAARDWTAFSFFEGSASEHFLAVANEYRIDKNGNKDYEVDSVIYKFDNGKFVPFQCIKTYGARRWVVYQGRNGEFLLAIINGQNGVFFYQYNGWRFVRTSFSVSGPGVVSASISYLPSTLNQLVLAVANPFESTSRPLVYYVKFEYSNPLGKYHEDAHIWCSSFTRSIANDGLANLVRRVESATKVTDGKNFTTAITIYGELKVTAVISNVINIVVLSQGIKIDFGQDAFTAIKNQIDIALARLAAVKILLENARRIISQTDMDGVHFSNVRIVCQTGSAPGRCSVDSLITSTVAGISASFNNVIRVDQSIELSNLALAYLTLSKGALMNVDYLSGSGISRIPFSEIVTLTGNHNIIGVKTFDKIQANYLLVSGTVGNIKISKDTLLLTVTEQRITQELTVDILTVASLDLLSLNGRDFKNFMSNLVLNGATQAFTGPLVIDGDLIVPSIRTLNPVTPVDPSTAIKNALLYNTGETQVITGSHTVRDFQALQGITVKGLVNSVSIPNNLFLKNGIEVINRPVIFQEVIAKMVTVDGSLGNVQFKDGKLDLLLLNGDQVVTGRKSFNEIMLLGQSTVSGTVAGHILQDLSVNVDEEFIKGINAGSSIIGTVTFSGGLTVKDDLINGVSISRILNYGVRLDSQNIKSTLTFEGPVQVDGDLRITNTLNGVNIGNYVLKDGTYTFTGGMNFATNLVIKANIAVGTVNGYDLSQLVSQMLVLNATQTISRDITLYSPEFKDLSVSGKLSVNGVNFDDVVTVNSDAIITGEKTFTTLRILSNVAAGAVDVGHYGTVDGVVISDLFFTDSLRKTGTTIQNLIGRSLNVVIAQSVTGTSLANLERRMVYKDRPESIKGSLKFNGPVTVSSLTFSGDFDGVKAEDFNSGWLLKTGTQTLTGQNYFMNLEAGDVTFTGSLIQGIDLNNLVKNTVKLDEPTTLGSVTFDEIISMSAITLSGKIQGFKIRDDALLKDGVNQVVTGIKTFWDTLDYVYQFSIDGTVLAKLRRTDDPIFIDVGGLCTSFSSTGTTNINNLTIDGDVLFGSYVNINQIFNGLPVTTLGNSFWLSDVSNKISSVTRFINVDVSASASLNIQGLLNDVDIRSLWDNILKKECDQQSVTGEFYLEWLTVDRLSTDTVTNSDDDLGLKDLLKILLKNGNQEITGILSLPKLESRESITLDGTLNNLRLDTDFVKYNTPATITGRKTFLSLDIQGDLNVQDESTVQGVDVSELVKLSIQPTTNGSVRCYIPGITTFKGLRIDSGSLEVGGTVDSVYLNKSRVLLKSEDQQMEGPLILRGQTSLEALDSLTVLTDKFNEINLARLRNYTVRNDRPNVINAAVTFTSTQTFSTVIILNNLINGYNVTDLGLCLKGKHIVGNMGDQFALVLRAAQDAQAMLAGKATDLWYFEETDLFTKLHKLIPASLTSNYLTTHTFDTLVGLDLAADLVYTFRFEKNFPQLYKAIPVTGPFTATGLSQNLLATCGKKGMTTFPNGSNPTPDFRQIPLESGENRGYGYVHSLAGQVGIEVAFGIYHCSDLVSFRLRDNRLCLAVIDHAATSTVMCGTAANGFTLMNYLGTKRAIKGAWMELGSYTYLLVVEHQLANAPGKLKVFVHDTTKDKMILISTLELRGADDVDVITRGKEAVIIVTARETILTNATVGVYSATLDGQKLLIKTIQTIYDSDAYHCSLTQTPSGELGLFIQTLNRIRVYLWKCVEFVYAREIRTPGAVWPSSEAFLYGNPGVLLIPFSAYGSWDPLTKEHTLDVVDSAVYTAIYRGTKTKRPSYLI